MSPFPSLFVPGVPGGIELLIIFFLLLVLFGVPLLLVLAFVLIRRGTNATTGAGGRLESENRNEPDRGDERDERIEALEREVEALRAKLRDVEE